MPTPFYFATHRSAFFGELSDHPYQWSLIGLDHCHFTACLNCGCDAGGVAKSLSRIGLLLTQCLAAFQRDYVISNHPQGVMKNTIIDLCISEDIGMDGSFKSDSQMESESIIIHKSCAADDSNFLRTSPHLKLVGALPDPLAFPRLTVASALGLISAARSRWKSQSSKTWVVGFFFMPPLP